MSIGLRLNGKYLGIEPGTLTVYANRDALGSWEAAEVTTHPTFVDVRFVAANRQLTITPGKALESRPAGAIGEWEELFLSTDQNVISRAGVSLEVVGEIAPPVAAVHLEQRGNDFVDAQGHRVVYPGCDGFLDYRIWLDQGQSGLDPFLKESHDLGFVVRRVFLQGDASQNGVLTLWPAREPNWRPQLRPFVTYCNAHGVIPLLTFCVDNQVVKSDLVALWTAAHAELQGLAYLASWGNELDKNGGDPNQCPHPGPGVFWSRGSKTQDTFYPPNGATAAEFHPVRNIEEGRTQMDAVASVFYMQAHGCGMLWLDESYPFDNPTPPHYAYDLGRLYATYWAVAVFHNRQGQRGQLLGPGTRACAEAWVKGMTLG